MQLLWGIFLYVTHAAPTRNNAHGHHALPVSALSKGFQKLQWEANAYVDTQSGTQIPVSVLRGKLCTANSTKGTRKDAYWRKAFPLCLLFGGLRSELQFAEARTQVLLNTGNLRSFPSSPLDLFCFFRISDDRLVYNWTDSKFSAPAIY